jgi:hypothetical protein
MVNRQDIKWLVQYALQAKGQNYCLSIQSGREKFLSSPSQIMQNPVPGITLSKRTTWITSSMWLPHFLTIPRTSILTKTFLNPLSKGTLSLTFVLTFRNTELLESATKYGHNVKHISVTGSINALTMGMPEELKDHVFTTNDYNSVTTHPSALHLTNRLQLNMPAKRRIPMSVTALVKSLLN